MYSALYTLVLVYYVLYTIVLLYPALFTLCEAISNNYYLPHCGSLTPRQQHVWRGRPCLLARLSYYRPHHIASHQQHATSISLHDVMLLHHFNDVTTKGFQPVLKHVSFANLHRALWVFHLSFSWQKSKNSWSLSEVIYSCWKRHFLRRANRLLTRNVTLRPMTSHSPQRRHTMTSVVTFNPNIFV